MKAQKTRLIKLVLISGLSMMAINGCVKVRLLTYPDSIKWIDNTELEHSMRNMARSMGVLDSLVNNESSPGSNRSEILRELQTVEAIATSLSPAGIRSNKDDETVPSSNHLLIDSNMDKFIEQILSARIQAENIPPDYYRVGQLTGSCNSCHQLR